jgi:hypothetical protein
LTKEMARRPQQALELASRAAVTMREAVAARVEARVAAARVEARVEGVA